MQRLRFLTTLLATLAMLVAFGSVSYAQSTPRVVSEGLVQGHGPTQVIYEFRNIAITTTNNCLAFSAKTDDACDNLALNQINVPRSFKASNIRLSVDVAGNAASTCDLFIEVAAAAAGTEMTAFSVVTLGAVINQAQNLTVLEGSLFAINISEDTGCYDTTPPTVSVWVEGKYLNQD